MIKQKTYYLIVKAGRKWFKVNVVDLLTIMAITTSKAEAKRLIDQGAVQITIG